MTYYSPSANPKSIALSQFCSFAAGYVIDGMQTVFETRRVRLESLVAKHGTVAALNEAIGMTRTDATLSQIRNPNLRRASSGKRYEMGDAIARRIETSLGLPEGWMDTPPTYDEIHGDARIGHAVKIMEAMPDWQRDQIIKILDTFAQPADPSTTMTGT